VLKQCAPHANPCRQAYELHLWGMNAKGRQSWDPLAVLVAVRGAASVNCSKMEEGGFNYVDENGANFWTPPDNSSNVSVQSLLTLSGTHPWREERELAGRAIDDLLCASPVVPESTSGRAG